jgi:hypothetical protein
MMEWCSTITAGPGIRSRQGDNRLGPALLGIFGACFAEAAERRWIIEFLKTLKAPD